MSREVGGGRRGAARGIQDTTQATWRPVEQVPNRPEETCVSAATWVNWGTYGA